MSTMLTNNGCDVQEVTNSADPPPASTVQVTHGAPKLPTISNAFFYKHSATESKTVAPKSYIFFDPRLKLKPYRIHSRDFITPPPPLLPQLPTPPRSRSLPSVALSSRMARPEIERIEKNFLSLRAIKEKASLSDDAFKEFIKAAEIFVRGNELECQMKPRMWMKKNWKDLAHKFIEDEGNGEKFWNTGRKGFNVETDLMYPEDKIDLAFLAFTMIRLESEKQFRTNGTKRKSGGTVGEADDEGSPPKKANTKQASTKITETETEAEVEDDAVASPNGSADASPALNKSSAAPKTPASAKPKPAAAKPTPKPAAAKPTPKPATVKPVPKPAAAAEGDTSTPAAVLKKTPARRKKVPLPPPELPEDDGETDEDDKTGDVVNGKNIIKGDPFRPARSSLTDFAFPRDGDLPIIVEPTTLSNEFLQFHGIDVAPIGDALEGRQIWEGRNPIHSEHLAKRDSMEGSPAPLLTRPFPGIQPDDQTNGGRDESVDVDARGNSVENDQEDEVDKRMIQALKAHADGLFTQHQHVHRFDTIAQVDGSSDRHDLDAAVDAQVDGSSDRQELDAAVVAQMQRTNGLVHKEDAEMSISPEPQHEHAVVDQQHSVNIASVTSVEIDMLNLPTPDDLRAQSEVSTDVIPTFDVNTASAASVDVDMLNPPVPGHLRGTSSDLPSEASTDVNPTANINFLVSFGPLHPAVQSISHQAFMPADTTFGALLAKVLELVKDDEATVARLYAATQCVMRYESNRTLVRQLSLKDEKLEGSWKLMMKRVTSMMGENEEDEVELEFH